MTIAAAMPITSLLSVAGSESSLPTWPPAATSMPARLAGSAVSRIRWAISSVSSSLPMLSSTGMKAICPFLLICDPLRSPKGLGAVSTSVQLEQGCARVLDRLLAGLIGDLAGVGPEDDRVRPVLLGREPFGQKVRRFLAVRAGQLQVVGRVRAKRPDQEPDDHEQDEPSRQDDPAPVGRERSKPVKELRQTD